MATVKYMQDEETGYFYLYTTSKVVVSRLSSLNFSYNPMKKHYRAFAKALPRAAGLTLVKTEIELQEIDVRPIPPAKLKRIKDVYNQKLILDKELEKLTEKLGKKAALLEALVVANGLQIKPALPIDSKVMIEGDKVRLHYRESVYSMYNNQSVEDLAKRYPALKKALRIEPRLVVDRTMLNEVLETLPGNIVNQIISLDIQNSFHETSIPTFAAKTHCVHCGHKLRKDKACKACGLKAKGE